MDVSYWIVCLTPNCFISDLFTDIDSYLHGKLSFDCCLLDAVRLVVLTEMFKLIHTINFFIVLFASH